MFLDTNSIPELVFFFGIGYLPGTDVITHRFVQSSGFLDKHQYKKAKKTANEYSVTLGYKNTLSHYLDFKTKEGQE